MQKTYGWSFIVFDREWLRHRLEEKHPDLAAKYSGVLGPDHERYGECVDCFGIVSDVRAGEPWRLYANGQYDAAAIEFQHLLSGDAANLRAWQALAVCQYLLYRYGDALVSINRACATG